MKKEFVPYKSAVKLKELGFDEPCMATISNIEAIHIKGTKRLPSGAMCTQEVNAPIWQQAFDWFREKGFHSWIYQSNRYSFHYTILRDGRYAKNGSDTINYNEARQACLEKLIELITKKD